VEGSGAAVAKALQPSIGGPFRHPGGHGGIDHAPAGIAHALDQQESTMDRHACILVDVHPRLPGKLFRSHNPSFNPKPRMNNLYSNDT